MILWQSPGAYLRYETDATSVTITSYNTLYATYPDATHIGVRADGADVGIAEPGAAGLQETVVALPEGADKIVDIITALRNMAVRAGFMSNDHKDLVLNLYRTGHLVPISEKMKGLRVDLDLDEVPNTVLRDEVGLKQVKFIMEQTRLMRIIKED